MTFKRSADPVSFKHLETEDQNVIKTFPATQATANNDLVEMTADVVCAYLANNSVVRQDIPSLIESVHKTFATLQNGPAAAPVVEPPKPAVPVKKSITPDYLISLEDGRQYKTLKRHLAGLGMTAEDYRSKWGLPADYPMVAPSYSERRSQLAREMGLGAKGRQIAKKTPSRRKAA